jgi:catalase
MQPGVLFTLFDAAQRQRLSGNTARQVDGVPRDVVARQIEHLRRADPAYAEGVMTELVEGRKKHSTGG